MVGTAARGVKFALENAALDLRAGDSGSAERSLKTALMHNPQDPDRLGRVAEIEAGRGRAEAKLLLRRALSDAPAAHALRVRLARLLQARGEFAEALSEVRKLPVKNREGFEIATLEAALLGMLGDTAGEIAGFTERLVVSNEKSAELGRASATR